MTSRPAAIAALVFSPLLASLAKAQNLTINDGNMVFQTNALSSSSHTPRSGDLRADALGTDHMFAQGWAYRIQGDSREFGFRDLGGVARATPTPQHADSDFADVDSRGLLGATMDWDVYDTGPASGAVLCRLNLTNISTGPVIVDVFSYLDIDACNSAGGDSAIGGLHSHRITDPCGVAVEFRGFGNDRTGVGAYPSIQNLLTNTSVDDLAGWSGSFGPGDYTGAFQWQDRTITRGETRTFSVLLAVDTFAACPPMVRHYGAGGGGVAVVPAISTDGLPLQDNSGPRAMDVIVTGALPQTVAALMSNVLPASTTFLGMRVLVDPTPPVQVPFVMTDTAGSARYTFTIPPGPYLCGLSVYHQWFTLDVAAANGLASFSGALQTEVGKL